MTSAGAPMETHSALAQWQQWLGAITDRLLALDGQAALYGTPDDVNDIATTFVARKAIGDRLAEIASTSDRRDADALWSRALVDLSGRQLGDSLRVVADAVDATVERIDERLGDIERTRIGEVERASAIAKDLDVAEPLAAALGIHVNHCAELRRRLGSGTNLDAVAVEASQLVASLRAADAERARLLTQLATLDDRRVALTSHEHRVRDLADRCRAKINEAPRLAVPSVAALGEFPDPDIATHQPWTALRTSVTAFVAKLERLGAALAEAERRYREPLTRRDDLRGLLHAFRDKAADAGFGEDPRVEPLYRAAADILWSAPCDVERAQLAVNAYIAAVNEVLR